MHFVWLFILWFSLVKPVPVGVSTDVSVSQTHETCGIRGGVS